MACCCCCCCIDICCCSCFAVGSCCSRLLRVCRASGPTPFCAIHAASCCVESDLLLIMLPFPLPVPLAPFKPFTTPFRVGLCMAPLGGGGSKPSRVPELPCCCLAAAFSSLETRVEVPAGRIMLVPAAGGLPLLLIASSDTSSILGGGNPATFKPPLPCPSPVSAGLAKSLDITSLVTGSLFVRPCSSCRGHFWKPIDRIGSTVIVDRPTTSKHCFNQVITAGNTQSLSLCTSSKTATGFPWESAENTGTIMVECTLHR
mmetsp:Transcript_19095/g.41177  ORF Transcript_19095/g.41177 Transcript_19095/m.41177 type:complete len:259 (+) Transcript_19095:474-1250(+)